MKSKSLLVILLLAFFGAFLVYRQYQPVSNEASPVQFTIARGQGIDRIAQNLRSAGLIRSIPAFKIEIMRQGVSKNIQAGDFTLSASMPLNTIVSSLTRGRSDITLTVLEGWRREEIAIEAGKIIGETFDRELFVDLTATLEGRLYPDTYSIGRSTTAQSLIKILTDNFVKKTQSLVVDQVAFDRALILASLIEREAITDEERPIVAGILQNRLVEGWPLQVDATIQYQKANLVCKKLDCDWWPTPLTRDDIDRPSTFNTYLNQGLPPRPISNPSFVSIKSALYPSKTDYWFYLHDPQGQIHYGKTLEEHNRNISKYL